MRVGIQILSQVVCLVDSPKGFRLFGMNWLQLFHLAAQSIQRIRSASGAIKAFVFYFLMTFRTLNEARWILGPLLVIWILGFLFYPLCTLPITLALAFTVYFFRDPERLTPSDPKAIVSPADGKVVSVEEVEETEFLHKRMQRISIFLSVFDVHVNRAPIEGTVVHSTFKKGAFFDARDPRSSMANQSRSWLFSDGKNQVVVRQITGAIARRIVAWSQVGDKLQKGERFGMIRFGSRTELYLPLDAKIEITVGAPVRGGQSVLALFS